MSSEYKFWIICWIILGITAIAITLGSHYLYNQRVKHYIDNGYTQKTLIGEDYCQWVKN